MNKRPMLTATVKKRLAAYAFAQSVLPEIQTIRNGLAMAGKKDSDRAIAKGLMDRGVLTPMGTKVWGHQTVVEVTCNTEKMIIQHAVLECRTRHTRLNKSAKFDQTAKDALETEYVEMIADALELGYKLRGAAVPDRSYMVDEAWIQAGDEARLQRGNGIRLPMPEREQLARKNGFMSADAFEDLMNDRRYRTIERERKKAEAKLAAMADPTPREPSPDDQ